jgi:putative ABC transport system permease protein
MPTLYVPLHQTQQAVRTLAFVVRTTGDPVALSPHVRHVVAEHDSTLPVFALRHAGELVSSSIAPQRFQMLVVAIFAWLALCLAVMGTYSVIAYTVAQSSREIGVRLAVGATRSNIVQLVVKRTLPLILAGILIGCAVAVGFSQVVRSSLFGVQPNDPGTLVLVALLMLFVSALATVAPAIRAAGTDPTMCLRSE